MEDRADNGRFIPGNHYSPKTEFKKGEHWREKKPFWNKEWLYNEYIIKQRSSSDIAKDFNLTDASILFWLRKHNIKRRTVSEARKIKHWGSDGSNNPMYGNRGRKSHAWKGGITPERQQFYSSLQWKHLVGVVWKRDKSMCQRCGKFATGHNMHIHHIIGFEHKLWRYSPENLVLLCAKCHKFIHSTKNTDKEFLCDD